MIKPRRFILSSNNTNMCFVTPCVTGWGHRNIEPTTMHHSLYHSLWWSTHLLGQIKLIDRKAYIAITIIHNKVQKRLSYFQWIIWSKTHNSSNPNKHTANEDYIILISEEIIVLQIRDLTNPDGSLGMYGTTHTSSWRQQGRGRWHAWSIPLPREYRWRTPDGIVEEQRLAAAEKMFVSHSRVLEIYAQMGSWKNKVSTNSVPGIGIRRLWDMQEWGGVSSWIVHV